jgi:hypothetical protein
MSVRARFGSAFLLAWAVFGTAFAGNITVDTTAYLGATSIQPISCSTSQSNTQSGSASATSACGDGLLTSTATGNLYSGLAGLFPNIQANADVEAVWSPLLSDTGTASVDASYTENLLITGGTGSGSLILDFSLTGQGGEDGSWTGGTVSANLNGDGTSTTFTNNTWLCGGDGDCTLAFYPYPQTYGPSQYVTIPFTFGVPFSFSEDLSLNAEAGDNGSAGVSATLGISGFSVLDPNGNAVSGAQVTDPPDAPEPGSLILCAGLLGLTAAGESVRRRRVSRQHRLMR